MAEDFTVSLFILQNIYSYQGWPCVQNANYTKFALTSPYTLPLVSLFHPFPLSPLCSPFPAKLTLGNIRDINIGDIKENSPLYFRVNFFFSQLKLTNGSYTKCLFVSYGVSSNLKCHWL